MDAKVEHLGRTQVSWKALPLPPLPPGRLPSQELVLLPAILGLWEQRSFVHSFLPVFIIAGIELFPVQGALSTHQPFSSVTASDISSRVHVLQMRKVKPSKAK